VSDVSDEDATRMLATFRPSRHVQMILCVADMSSTIRACRARGIWRMTPASYEDVAQHEQTDCRDIVRSTRHNSV